MKMHTEVSNNLPLRDDSLRGKWYVHGETMSSSTLPAKLRNPPCSNLEQATRRLFVRFARQEAHKGCDILLLYGKPCVSTISIAFDDTVEPNLNGFGVATSPKQRRSDHAQQQQALSNP